MLLYRGYRGYHSASHDFTKEYQSSSAVDSSPQKSDQYPLENY